MMEILMAAVTSFILWSPVRIQRRCSMSVRWMKKRGTSVSSLPDRLLPWGWRIFLAWLKAEYKYKYKLKIKIICSAGVSFVICRTFCSPPIIWSFLLPCVTSWVGPAASLWLVRIWEPREGVVGWMFKPPPPQFICWNLKPNVLVFGDGALGR